MMRIGLTVDLQTDATNERQAEFDPPRTIAALRVALETLGHQVVPLGNAHDVLRAPQRLRGIELVFNLAEGTDSRCREAWAPTVCELHGVSYVGSDPLALMLGLDKAMSKRLAQAAGILTPPWISIEHPSMLPDDILFPVIVKPRYEGSGRGIDAEAVVSTRHALEERVGWLFTRCPEPMLIETFIPEGELTVCVIGNDSPTAYPAIQRPLDPATRLSYHVISQHPSAWITPLTLTDDLDAEARRIALAMFETLGCRDMARVDLRVDAAGRVHFLEINPLPSFDPEGTFGLLAEYIGVRYHELIGRILDSALTRLKRAAIPSP